jgi:hypothetical protein
MVLLWLTKVLPFLHRWQDALPAACCGHCGPCVTAAATGITLEVKASRAKKDAA